MTPQPIPARKGQMTRVLFFVLLIIFSSYASHIMGKSNSKEKPPSSNSAQSPQIDFEREDQFTYDDRLNTPESHRGEIVSFCHECIHECKLVDKRVFACSNFICLCSPEKLDD